LKLKWKIEAEPKIIKQQGATHTNILKGIRSKDVDAFQA